MASHRTTRPLGTTDFILGTVLASVLLVTTACGGTSTPEKLEAAAVAAPASSIPATTGAKATAGAKPAPTRPAATSTPSRTAVSPAPAFAAKALDTLATLPVKGRAPKTGYSRSEFGAAWTDVDKNGCDTRNDILNRDLTATTFKPGTHGCIVLTGVLADPYTATTIHFTRGATSSAVQIDHVVALSDAWQKGAQKLTAATRLALANDPANLLAVDGPSNQQKSDGDAATWLPPNKAYRCDYVARQVSVKAAYSLWVTAGEHDAMAAVLKDCAPAKTPAKTIVKTPAAVPAKAPAAPSAAPSPAARKPVPVPPAASAAPAAADQGVVYANCAAVRAAGKAPILAGQPGYSTKLDRDGDGIGCE
uniref:GmrSD restriction endonuclease domain-containing protein n=1 Tax=Arthrobacter sp. ERGS1:01 TaxID=1704044 RepID=UPI0009E801B0|nr:DUF1524 domain-containing protein [Arthrobacter sp. ERGS1:01]